MRPSGWCLLCRPRIGDGFVPGGRDRGGDPVPGDPGILGIAHHPLLAVVVGATFQWEDLLAYAIGALIALLIDAKTRWWSNHS